MKWPLPHQDSDLVIGVSDVQDRNRLENTMNDDHLRIISDHITSEHPMFKCSNILYTGALMKRKKGGGVGMHFRSEPDNHHMLVNIILACNRLFFETLDPEQDASSDPNLHSGFD